jgi:hypothetical protein
MSGQVRDFELTIADIEDVTFFHDASVGAASTSYERGSYSSSGNAVNNSGGTS